MLRTQATTAGKGGRSLGSRINTNLRSVVTIVLDPRGSILQKQEMVSQISVDAAEVDDESPLTLAKLTLSFVLQES